MVRWIDPSWVDPYGYFSFQPVLHDWCDKGCGVCYPVCGMVHIKEPLLLIDMSSLCGGSGFPFSLSEWSLTISLTPYNRRYNVLSASLNKTFLSLSLSEGCSKCREFRDRNIMCPNDLYLIIFKWFVVLLKYSVLSMFRI